MHKKFSMIVALLLVFALTIPTSAAVFTDVSDNHWAYEAVNELVAAGIISGYPDGTFKGNNSVSRYEIAIIVSRVLDRVAEEREDLSKEMDVMKDGFTSSQKLELKDIVKSIVEENMPEDKHSENEGLTEKEYEQIANLIEALTFNYRAELTILGADINDLENLVESNKAEVDNTISELREEMNTVVFSGETGVDLKHTEIDKATDDTNAYKNPFNTDNGTWYDKWPGANDNEYDEDNYFYSYVDLDTTINTEYMTVDLNLYTNDQFFGTDENDPTPPYEGNDEQQPELKEISGKITTEDFTADFGDVDVQYTDYLLYDNAADLTADYYPWENTTEMPGIYLEAENGFEFILGKEDDVEGPDEDEDDEADYTFDRITLAGKNSTKLMDENFDIYFGAEKHFDLSDTAEKKENVLLGGIEYEKEVSPMTLNFETAMSKKGDINGHLFRMGGTTEAGLISLEGNYENTQDFTGIRDAWYFGNTQGYDFTASTEYGPVKIEGYYENYDEEPIMNSNFDLDTKISGFELTGNFKHERIYSSDEDKMKFGQQLRNLKISKQFGKFTLTSEYDYEADINALEPYGGYGYTHKHEIDDGKTSTDLNWLADSDNNGITTTLDVEMNEYVSGYIEFDYDLASSYDEENKKWEEDDNPKEFELGGNVEYGIMTASITKNMNQGDDYKGDTEISTTITPDTLSVMGIDFDSKLENTYFMYLGGDTAYNLLADLDSTYKINDSLTLEGGYEYNRKYDLGFFGEYEDYTEEDGDLVFRPGGNDDSKTNLHGVLKTANLGLEYKLSDDISAEADYNNIQFEGENTDDNYTVNEVTAGMSVTF